MFTSSFEKQTFKMCFQCLVNMKDIPKMQRFKETRNLETNSRAFTGTTVVWGLIVVKIKNNMCTSCHKMKRAEFRRRH